MQPTPSIVDMTSAPESPLRYLQIRYNPYPDEFRAALPEPQPPVDLPRERFVTCYHRVDLDEQVRLLATGEITRAITITVSGASAAAVA